jgi:hypothetical protein
LIEHLPPGPTPFRLAFSSSQHGFGSVSATSCVVWGHINKRLNQAVFFMSCRKSKIVRHGSREFARGFQLSSSAEIVKEFKEVLENLLHTKEAVES